MKSRTGEAVPHLVRIASAAVLVMVALVFAGYSQGDRALIAVIPGLQGMSPITGLGLAILALALLAESWGRRRLATAAAGVALALGVGMLIAHGLNGRDLVSPLVSSNVFGRPPGEGGRTSVATAVCISLLGAAGLLRGRRAFSDIAAAAAMVIAGFALMGYAYGVDDLYAVPVFDTMALNTAIGLFILALMSTLVRTQEGVAAVIFSRHSGGGATRRQLAFVLVPPIAGWLLLRASDAHDLGPAAAMAFLVMITIAPLTLLILRDGQVLDDLDAERASHMALQSDHAERLETRLAEQALELESESAERANAEAAMYRAQRMEAVGQLTGGIAHDFNNLLMGIGGNLQLLAKRLEAEHPARRYADNAIVATDKGAKLTAQLLAFSRTQKLDVRAVELDPVLNAARDLVGNALGPGVDLELSLNTSGGWASTDPDQLELAILNLALNARDAMPSGGVIRISTERRRAHLKDEAEASDYLVVSVNDTGEGMSPDVAARAFEPFFTTKERGKGTGLGLAQVYGFVRQCRGDLRIDSHPGRGTTIELLLPVASAQAEPARAVKVRDQQEIASRLGQRRLLLVIDDDDTVRGVLVETLRGAGFDVVEASNGADGLAQLQAHRPAAAIIDFIMPGLNGVEVARRAQAEQPGLPIIFVSGYFDTIAMDGISGATVLRKPFDVEGLHRTVAAVLN